MTKSGNKEAGPRNILVPVDFSAASKNAFRYALGWAHEGSRFMLLHVVPPTKDKGRLASRMITSARRSLVSFAKNARAGHVHSLRYNVRTGTPFQEILAAAQDNNTDLIVLGVDDSDPLGGLALGHTADRVSRYAKCPVLLVREPSATTAPGSFIHA